MSTITQGNTTRRRLVRDGRYRSRDDSGPRDASTVPLRGVITMVRKMDELLAHADELAKQFEDYEPRAEDLGKEPPLMALRRGVPEGPHGA